MIAPRLPRSHPFYTASIREFAAAGRPVVGSAPVGKDGTAAWLEAIGAACGVVRDKIAAAQNKAVSAIDAALAKSPIKGRITLSGYEGSELLVARLLIESGADVPYVGTACPRTPWSDPDREWLESKGARVQYRASLEQDIAAFEEFGPDLASVQPRSCKKRRAGYTGALLHESDFGEAAFGAAGAGSLAQVINAAIANKPRFDQMKEFFSGVGEGYAAGVWEDTPRDRR